MKRPDLNTRLFLGSAVLALSACATSTRAPASERPPATEPPAAPVEEALPDRSSDDQLKAFDWAEEDFEALPPTAAGPAPSAAGGREAFREASRPARPMQDFLPFIDVAIDQNVLVAGFGPALQDRYTRIQIVTLDPDSYDVEGVAGEGRTAKKDTRNYEKESRGWLARTMLGSRSVTRTLLAEFDIANPDIRTSKALFSSTFQSDSARGEAWATNESVSVYATPYFKVSPNTTIEGRFRMQLSDERQSTAGANVMNALQTAANLIAPTSALVTFFNAPAMAQASTFLNTQATSLFGQSISEQSTGAFAIKSWTSDPILVIRAEMPPPGNIKDTRRKEGVGKWVVYLEPPIPSVFTTYTLGGTDNVPDYTGVSASDVLSFQIGADLRVYDYIFSRLDMNDRITALNETGDPDTARVICTRIARGLSEIGFTTFDAAAGVWAASESDQFSSLARTALQDPAVCQPMALWSELN